MGIHAPPSPPASKAPGPSVDPARRTTSALSAAWVDAGRAWRLAAIGLTAVVLAATHLHDALPSGIAVVLLVPAALVDLRERRLPDPMVATSAVAFLAAVSLSAAFAAGELRPASILIGSALMAGPLLAVHLVSPAAMGFGDVKAAAVLGMAVGAVHWHLALSALALASGLTATVGVARRRRTLPFGPGLVAGTALALAAQTLLLPAEPRRDLVADGAPPQIAVTVEPAARSGR